MSDKQRFHLTKIDWRWLVVTYCFLVLFHLLPSLLASGLQQFFLSKGTWRFIVWAGGGIALVSTYVGRRSNDITILEPGVASMLYMATLIPTASNISDMNASGYRLVGLLVALHLMAFLVGCFGAAAGEWMQARRERKEVVSENS
jgi:hypothetical protein